MKKGDCGLCQASWWLVWLGALNWGLVGLFDWNLVEVVLGGWPWLVRLLYILIGISAIGVLMAKKGMCKKCK